MRKLGATNEYTPTVAALRFNAQLVGSLLSPWTCQLKCLYGAPGLARASRHSGEVDERISITYESTILHDRGCDILVSPVHGYFSSLTTALCTIVAILFVYLHTPDDGPGFPRSHTITLRISRKALVSRTLIALVFSCLFGMGSHVRLLCSQVTEPNSCV